MAATKKVKEAPPPTEKDPAVTAYEEAFRLRLKMLREEAGYTQAALCELIDVPLASYKHIEGKRASPFPPHKLGKLSGALRRSVHYIVTGREWRGVAEEQTRHVA